MCRCMASTTNGPHGPPPFPARLMAGFFWVHRGLAGNHHFCPSFGLRCLDCALPNARRRMHDAENPPSWPWSSFSQVSLFQRLMNETLKTELAIQGATAGQPWRGFSVSASSIRLQASSDLCAGGMYQGGDLSSHSLKPAMNLKKSPSGLFFHPAFWFERQLSSSTSVSSR